MKQFNLEEYLKNPTKKVITGSGKSVRILCTNRLDATFPIVALIYNEANETIQCYTKNGKITSKCPCFEYDLFFAPEKKEGWINLYKINSITSIGPRAYSTEEEAKSMVACNSANYISTIKIKWEE